VVGLIVAIVAAAFVVLLPGLAAVLWVTRQMAAGAEAPNLAQKIAFAYAGLGLACLSLWLGVAALGISRWTSIAAPLAASALVALAVIGRRRIATTGVADAGTRHNRTVERTLVALSLASACLVAIPFVTYGWERADGVHRMAMSDWEKHLVMTTAIAASPTFPPPHPYFHSDPRPSYYFGYHLVAAAITTMGSASTTVFASLFLLTLATAAAAPFVVYTFSTDLCSNRQAVLAAGASTLFVGFDAVVLALDTVRATIAAWPLPGGFAGLRAIVPSTHIDYWVHNVNRSFSPPIISTMWAPHQTAATLIALLVLYLLAPRPDDPARARTGWLLPALLVASLPALSSYIAMALAVGIAAAIAAEAGAARRAPWRTTVFQRWALPGTIGFLAALPIYPVLTRGSSSGLMFYISTAGTWTNGAIFSWLFGASQWTNLLDTPALYLAELGIIGLLGLIQILYLVRARHLTPVQQQAAALVISVLLLLAFVRPPVDIGNNLYARALLLVWFVLAPFAAVAASRIGRRRWLGGAVLICALGTCYAEVGYLLQGSLFWPTSKTSVEALRWINDHTPARSVVAIRPAEYENNYGYWLRRPLVLGGKRLAVLFGADPQHFDRTAASLEAAYAHADADLARRGFDALEADVILVRSDRLNPGWADSPCFDIAHPNSAWSVVLRNRGACARQASPEHGDSR
jgi:hypothetical protein